MLLYHPFYTFIDTIIHYDFLLNKGEVIFLRCLLQIRVNAIHPTIVMTDMGRRAWEDPKKHMKYLVRTPMGHFAGTMYMCISIVE